MSDQKLEESQKATLDLLLKELNISKYPFIDYGGTLEEYINTIKYHFDCKESESIEIHRSNVAMLYTQQLEKKLGVKYPGNPLDPNTHEFAKTIRHHFINEARLHTQKGLRAMAAKFSIEMEGEFLLDWGWDKLCDAIQNKLEATNLPMK